MTETVPLIADLHTVRCGGCKVLVDDPLVVKCSICGATFDRVVSNHVGLANRLNSERSGSGEDDVAEEEAPGEVSAAEELVAVPRSVLSELAAAVADLAGTIEQPDPRSDQVGLNDIAAVAAKLAESAPTVDAGDAAGAAGEAAAKAREAGSLV